MTATQTMAAEAASRNQGAAEAGLVQECGQTQEAGGEQVGQEVEEAGEPASRSRGPRRAERGAAGRRRGRRRRYRRLNGIEMGAWRSFLTASTAVVARLNYDLEVECGISMHEYEILVRLSEAPERSMRMSALARDISYSRSRLTHTVGRLEREGYVARVSCSSDRRGVNCELTSTGLAFLRQAAPIHLAGVRRHVVDRLSRDQLVAMRELMSLIAEVPEAP